MVQNNPKKSVYEQQFPQIDPKNEKFISSIDDCFTLDQHSKHQKFHLNTKRVPSRSHRSSNPTLGINAVKNYNHPMSKWMHIAYSSPKPNSSRVYQELRDNYNQAVMRDNERFGKKTIEKEAPFKVVWLEHAELLAGSKINFDSIQSKSMLVFLHS